MVSDDTLHHMLFLRYGSITFLARRHLITLSQETEERNEVRRVKKLPRLDVKIVKERHYTYGELEVFAQTVCLL